MEMLLGPRLQPPLSAFLLCAERDEWVQIAWDEVGENTRRKRLGQNLGLFFSYFCFQRASPFISYPSHSRYRMYVRI